MCAPKTPNYESTAPKEIIHAPTYADAQTQSAVANAKKGKSKNPYIKTSARGVSASEEDNSSDNSSNNTDSSKTGLFEERTKTKKKTLGE